MNRWRYCSQARTSRARCRQCSHHLRVHNTLLKTIDFTVTVGEHASFVATNRGGFGTYSFFAYLLGCYVIYLKVEREVFPGHRS